MDTKQSFNQSKASQLDSLQEYKLAVIAKNDLQEAFGIAAQDDCDPDVLYIKEIGTDKELVLSIIDTLNTYRVSFVHFQDVISDLTNKQY